TYSISILSLPLLPPPPPPPPLFPYTTLFRSLHVRDHSAPQLIVECRHAAMKLTVTRRNATFIDQSDSEIIEALLAAAKLKGDVRSEEHTSELQSRVDLVCRLLLEKKKNKNKK